jgi:hypothetical protein
MAIMRQFKPGQLQTGSIYPITASSAVTASYANIALSASYAISASYEINYETSSSYAETASFAQSASYALTASYTLGLDTGSLTTTASFNAFTASYTTGSFTGSFTGDGSQLTGIVSSKWTGSNPISRDGNVEITGSLIVSGTYGGINTAFNKPFLFDGSGISRVDWGQGYLKDTSDILSIDWESRLALDSTEVPSIDWTTRVLVDSTQATVLDWENKYFEGTASVSDRILTQRNNSNSQFYPIMVDSSNSPGAYETVYNANGITFNPATSGITAVSFTGSLLGTASFADTASIANTASVSNQILTQKNNDNSQFYPLMVDSANTTPNPETVYSPQTILFNPGTGDITAVSFTGLASLAQTASLALRASGSLTGSLLGTASFASTASYVNPLIQNVLITGSLTVTGSAPSTLFRVGTNDLVVTGSRIGIGTATPIDAVEIVGPNKYLQINGVTSTDRSAWIGNDSAGTGNVYLFNGTNSNTVFITGNGSSFLNGGNVGIGLLQLSISASLHISGTNAATLLRIDAPGSSSILHVTGSGRVGIGTATPSTTLNVVGTTLLSGSANTISGSSLTVYGSGSTQPVFTVQGSQGELFSVTDSLTGSLFSVNDISGLPILEVFSDNTTLIGNYLDPMLITTAKVTQTNSGSFVVYSLPTASYDTAFFEYSVKSGSNARAGTIMAIQSGTSVNFTETTTTDFGDTSVVSFAVIVTGSNMALTGSSTSGAWTIKSIVRGL